MNKIDRLKKEAKILPSQCGNSSAGRAIPCQGIGREFEPRFPLHHFFFIIRRSLLRKYFVLTLELFFALELCSISFKDKMAR
tara:strand:- start:36 stop:281 length:246 start_codon:yes stop_codon:yes gene_type:complete